MKSQSQHEESQSASTSAVVSSQIIQPIRQEVTSSQFRNLEFLLTTPSIDRLKDLFVKQDKSDILMNTLGRSENLKHDYGRRVAEDDRLDLEKALKCYEKFTPRLKQFIDAIEKIVFVQPKTTSVLDSEELLDGMRGAHACIRGYIGEYNALTPINRAKRILDRVLRTNVTGDLREFLENRRMHYSLIPAALISEALELKIRRMDEMTPVCPESAIDYLFHASELTEEEFRKAHGHELWEKDSEFYLELLTKLTVVPNPVIASVRSVPEVRKEHFVQVAKPKEITYDDLRFAFTRNLNGSYAPYQKIGRQVDRFLNFAVYTLGLTQAELKALHGEANEFAFVSWMRRRELSPKKVKELFETFAEKLASDRELGNRFMRTNYQDLLAK